MTENKIEHIGYHDGEMPRTDCPACEHDCQVIKVAEPFIRQQIYKEIGEWLKIVLVHGGINLQHISRMENGLPPEAGR